MNFNLNIPKKGIRIQFYISCKAHKYFKKKSYVHGQSKSYSKCIKNSMILYLIDNKHYELTDRQTDKYCEYRLATH